MNEKEMNEATKKVAKRLLGELYQGKEAPFKHPQEVVDKFLRSQEAKDNGVDLQNFGQDEVRGFEEMDPEVADTVLKWIANTYDLKNDSKNRVHLDHAVPDTNENDSDYEVLRGHVLSKIEEIRQKVEDYEIDDRHEMADLLRDLNEY